MQPGAALFLLLRLRRDFRQRQAGIGGEPFDRFGKGEALGRHEKIEDIAVLARGEIEPGHFLVIDEERRRLFRGKGRQAAPFPPGLHELHLPPHHLGDGQSRLQFFEKGGCESHRHLLVGARAL